MFAVVRKIVSKHGLGGLYKGMHLHILRDTIGSGLYFGIYETTKQVISTSLGEHQPTFGAPMAAGALSGTIPWLLVRTLIMSLVNFSNLMFSRPILWIRERRVCRVFCSAKLKKLAKPQPQSQALLCIREFLLLSFEQCSKT